MYEDLVRRLREYAEWARASEWETPLRMGDDLLAAADAIEGLESDNSALRIKQKMSAARTSCQLNPQEQCQVWQENRQLQAELGTAVKCLCASCKKITLSGNMITCCEMCHWHDAQEENEK